MPQLYLLLGSLLFFSISCRGQCLECRTGQPGEMRIIAEDIDRFWQAYDLAYPWFLPELLDSLYLRRASSGLRDCIPLHMGNPEAFSREVAAHWDHYEYARMEASRFEKQAPQIRAAMYALKYLYPEARFPDIYFVIAPQNMTRLAMAGRLVINAAQFAADTTATTRARRDAPSVFPLSDLHLVVARELIRFQQPAAGPLSLLAMSIREGVADFIAELVTGQVLRPQLHRYAEIREAALWQSFSAQMNDWSTSGWLYRDATNRPDNLGIWIGYRIAQAYYQQAPDKRLAIRNMLHIRDYRQFLLESGYAGQFDHTAHKAALLK
jgi:hypothetical protein